MRRRKDILRIRMGRRAVWVCFFVLLMWASLAGRLYQLQILHGRAYAQMAFNQRTLSLPVGNRRGLILDRRGVPLSDTQTHWGVAAFPSLIKNQGKSPEDAGRTVEATARAVASALGMWEDEVYQQLLSETSPFWIKKDVHAGLAEQVAEMGLPGIAVGPLAERYGPGALAHQLVGYTNESGGQLGLEKLYDKELKGERTPSLIVDLDGKGQPLAGLGIRTMTPTVGKEPDDVHTTIDVRIQQAVEQVIDQQRHPAGGPWRGAVVVMDPKSGELLAMASRPRFDYAHLNDALQEKTGSYLLDRAVSATAPGSVFKAVVAAAALDSGEVTPDEKFYCPGHYTVGGTTFYDANHAGHGWLTFQEAVAKSCNIVFLKVGLERLGIQRIQEAAERFGFGAATGILGSEEAAGYIPKTAEEGAAQMAFGQGLTVTPVQIARAFSAIANGGALPPVSLVTEIKTPAGEVVRRSPTGESKVVMSRETNRQLQAALRAVTDPSGSGTGRAAWIPGAGSAGKTGSAEEGKAVDAWFAGYFPAAAPRYVVVVMLEGGQAGGTYAAPIFRQIGEAILAIGAN